jgi:hypothetical protein
VSAPSLLERIQHIFTGQQPTALATTPSTKITDDGGWDILLSGSGPADRPWHDVAQDLDDALEAWRRNFLIRQIVRLTTAYVVGDGITIRANNKHATTFVHTFWHHPQNNIPRRLAAWCDELTRTGELFIALFPNPIDGMSYVRAIPARQIHKVETDPEDYERETAYYENAHGWEIEPKRWASIHTAHAIEPCMLHYTINKPVGATRGEGDLTPLLPWARRYTEWLKDRVRFNKLRTEMATAWIKIQDETKLDAKRRQYAANPPTGGSVFVTGPGEDLSFPSSRIDAGDASPDGLAIRLAVAAGANIPLHFLAEGSSATRSTAQEMSDPTRRHYRMRQLDFAGILSDLAQQAYTRRGKILGHTRTIDIRPIADMPDVSREDNQALALAAHNIVRAFAIMKEYAWIDDQTATELSFKFAGEILTDEQLTRILQQPRPIEPTLPKGETE